MSEEQAQAVSEAVARRSYGKLIALLASRTQDVAAAEDALADAFSSALADWPRTGCPANPEAWLLTAARRRLIDGSRRHAIGEAAARQLQLTADEVATMASGDELPDRRLALMFVCAHPAIDVAARAPLMLQVVVGMTAEMIASAFLTSPSAMSKRLVRAKEKIRQAGIPFRVPERAELPERLQAVLEATYATYTEGWSEPAGADLARRELKDEAIFLARLVVELMPDEPEALGLLALLLHTEARRPARRSVGGDYVPLDEQDLALWNWPMIEEAESLLRRASGFGQPGRFQLESAIQSAHVARRRTGSANWADLVQLYDALLALTASPVVAINRALAIAEVRGAPFALRELPADVRLAQYQPYWAARAALLARAGDSGQAREAYAMAVGLERDPAIRRFLQQRQAVLPVDAGDKA